MDYSEISESLVNEIIEENYHKQRRESAEMNALVLQRIELSDRMQKCTEPLSQEIKDVLENYLDTINNLEAKRSEYLYVQGAKDCVLLLQKLGVIR